MIRYNLTIGILILVIIVVNVFITAFGGQDNCENWRKIGLKMATKDKEIFE